MVRLELGRHLVARGELSVTDGSSSCTAGQQVAIQRRTAHGWIRVGVARTRDNGAFRIRVPDHVGTYRARVVRVTLADGWTDCGRDVSARLGHQHAGAGPVAVPVAGPGSVA